LLWKGVMDCLLYIRISLTINDGGRGGIRTLGGFNTTAAFQATALNRYATRPKP
jgi:hypothetical protein